MTTILWSHKVGVPLVRGATDCACAPARSPGGRPRKLSEEELDYARQGVPFRLKLSPSAEAEKHDLKMASSATDSGVLLGRRLYRKGGRRAFLPEQKNCGVVKVNSQPQGQQVLKPRRIHRKGMGLAAMAAKAAAHAAANEGTSASSCKNAIEPPSPLTQDALERTSSADGRGAAGSPASSQLLSRETTAARSEPEQTASVPPPKPHELGAAIMDLKGKIAYPGKVIQRNLNSLTYLIRYATKRTTYRTIESSRPAPKSIFPPTAFFLFASLRCSHDG